MKKMICLSLITCFFSIQAEASRCRAWVSGSLNYSIPLASGKTVIKPILLEAENLESCIKLAQSYLGRELAIAPQGYEWKGTGVLKIEKVRYFFKSEHSKGSGVLK